MDREIVIRVCFFLSIFAVISIWEILASRRMLTTSKKARWFSNLVLLSLNPISVRLVFPLLPVSMSILAEERHWGLLNNIGMPYWLKVVMGVIVLDLAIYLQHVLHHSVPLLWRLHMVHHSDLDFDLTTGLRFHPMEIVLSMGIKLMAVAALGPSAPAVLIFEVALNSTSMFNHSNVFLPSGVDRVLRLFVVTPEMHRVHHSVIIRETNSNFGFNVSWGDRLFGTYRAQPANGHEAMTIGVSHIRDPGRLTLPRLIVMPFVDDPGAVPINRH
jgi:sterol desaturase/sphingolipid hydroxylase (fatty acid hydroxylase superfamily)